MSLYRFNSWYQLREGDLRDEIKWIKDESIDSIITDPPYGLTTTEQSNRGFMNKEWDGNGVEKDPNTWKECLRVLKPGGYLLAFGGSRTFHRIACSIEDAGFEIRDTIMWLYGTGFPKNFNIGFAIDRKNGVDNTTGTMLKAAKSGGRGIINDDGWQPKDFIPERIVQNEFAGWGTTLKPAYEPIIVARKPCIGTVIDNMLTYGTGGMNIDACKIGNEVITKGTQDFYGKTLFNDKNRPQSEKINTYFGTTHIGRYPANVICNEINEEWARYFYCPKASTKDRDDGLDEFGDNVLTDGHARTNKDTARKYNALQSEKKNIHPTVKPTELMQWLIRLVTPPSGKILDPFCGSGSTGKAAMCENKERNSHYEFIGIEITPEYLPIADARIKWALEKYKPGLSDNVMENQLSLF